MSEGNRGLVDRVSVTVLPTFTCQIEGQVIDLSQGSKDLIVLLVLNGRSSTRRAVEAALWPDVPAADAAKRMRQLLWRTRQRTGDRLLVISSDRLAFAPDVHVDFAAATEYARQVVRGATSSVEYRELLGSALLSGWMAPEICAARDRWDQMRGIALEYLAERHLEAGDLVAAIDCAVLAIEIDELCEGPHRMLFSAHLARGDHASARRTYLKYADVLRRELGLAPSPEFQHLVARGPDVRMAV